MKISSDEMIWKKFDEFWEEVDRSREPGSNNTKSSTGVGAETTFRLSGNRLSLCWRLVRAAFAVLFFGKANLTLKVKK